MPVARVRYQSGWWFRMRGLLGKTGLEIGTGIWLSPCNSIHMFFMKFGIDALFLDAEHRVVKIAHALVPWRAVLPVAGARSCLELMSGAAARAGIREGDLLHIQWEPDLE